MALQLKTVGASGQLSLGKKYAGRTVSIEEPEEGVWVIKTCRVIPENELWMWEPETKARIDEALEWIAKHPRKESDLDALERKLNRKRR
jgi:hypothetical protein